MDRKWRYTCNGAVIGLLITASDLIEWRGPQFSSWQTADGLAHNAGQFLGAAVIGGFFGMLWAVMKSRSAPGSV